MKAETHNPHETFGIVGRFDVMNSPPKQGELGAFKFRDTYHTPYNKRFREVDSWVELVVTDMPKGVNTDHVTKMSAPVVGWTEVQVTEHVKHGERTTSKTISLTLSHDARKALLAYLLAEAGA